MCCVGGNPCEMGAPYIRSSWDCETCHSGRQVHRFDGQDELDLGRHSTGSCDERGYSGGDRNICKNMCKAR